MKNVLVFSCGSLIAIDVNFALRGNEEFKVYGASSYEDHGVYVYENYIGNVPFIYEENFIPEFNEMLKKYEIDFIMPMHETMILFFQENKDHINATIVSSGYETALLCRYKSKTYEKLKRFSFVPRTYSLDEVDEFPVFVKKDDDQGARNAYRVDTEDQLRLYSSRPDMIICEYLPGEEVTIDCLTDRTGKLRICNPRIADRIVAGIDVHARRVCHDDEILRIAETINSEISFRGAWFFQLKRDIHGAYKLLEIATRLAGAFSLTRCMDINLPLLALKDADDQDVEISFNDLPIESDKIFFSRYTLPIEYTSVYIDGEHTFVSENQVDSFFMMFLFQCRNKGRQLKCITHDITGAAEQINKSCIHGDMIELVDYRECDLSVEKAIFISKSDKRRKHIRESFGIPCFDPSIIEVLLDWRG